MIFLLPHIFFPNFLAFLPSQRFAVWFSCLTDAQPLAGIVQAFKPSYGKRAELPLPTSGSELSDAHLGVQLLSTTRSLSSASWKMTTLSFQMLKANTLEAVSFFRIHPHTLWVLAQTLSSCPLHPDFRTPSLTCSVPPVSTGHECSLTDAVSWG